MTAVDTSSLAAWVEAHWLSLLVLAVLALVLFRLAHPLVHRLVARIVRPVDVEGIDRKLAADEAAKRAATLEDLLAKALRFSVVLAVALGLLTVFDLLPVLAGLAIVIAALTVAGQAIVLDYLMGVLILAEGQFSKGDWLAVGAIEGTVEEVGIRRTVVRDASGTVHSISNGTIRVSSNLTRVYANLQVDVTITEASQIDRAVAVIDEVGAAMAADPAWRDALLETPRCTRVLPLTATGITLRATGRIRAADRWAVPSEFRRRLVEALETAGVSRPLVGFPLGVAPPEPPTPGG